MRLCVFFRQSMMSYSVLHIRMTGNPWEDMKSKRAIAGVLIVLLLVAAGYGIFRTKPPAFQTEGGPLNAASLAASTLQGQTLVDQSALTTAQRLAQTPTTLAEQPFAQEALRLADKEMDMAFATAVREAAEHPPVLSPEAKQIETKLQKGENAVDADKAQVAQLTAAEDKATGSRKDTLDDQLDLAKAQLELDQDEVDDAKQDLIGAGGDPQGRIQTMVEEHEAASQSSDSTKVLVSAPAETRGLVRHFLQWWAFHQKQLQLWRAKQEAESASATLFAKHKSLEQKIDVSKQKSAPTPPPASSTGTQEKPATRSREESETLVNSTKARSAQTKALSTLDKRVENEKKLAEIYGKWIGVVAAEQRTVLNSALGNISIILIIALIGLFFDGWIEKLLGRTSLDRRQVETLRAVTRVSLQVAGVVLILLVIIGPPPNLGTFLGLAGAGLTVALKDFIVGFIGWFVLMGKNGIRLGDWVEINGVTGEVVELGMFHTVLLETGNWTDSGHPTGRRVTFTNSFAIEGHYFNFSTSGQWLWDELQVVLPAGQDPYPLVDAIQKKVIEATAESGKKAEQEWRGTARAGDMRNLSAAPAINVKPVIGGVEIAVRYITNAHERYEIRAKLNHILVDLLGGKAPAPEVRVTPTPGPEIPLKA
jgi:small-conductance mechanosensitive channel